MVASVLLGVMITGTILYGIDIVGMLGYAISEAEPMTMILMVCMVFISVSLGIATATIAYDTIIRRMDGGEAE